jgi:hypothetical protein
LFYPKSSHIQAYIFSTYLLFKPFGGWFQGRDSPSLELCYLSLWLALLQWKRLLGEKTVIVELDDSQPTGFYHQLCSLSVVSELNLKLVNKRCLLNSKTMMQLVLPDLQCSLAVQCKRLHCHCRVIKVILNMFGFRIRLYSKISILTSMQFNTFVFSYNLRLFFSLWDPDNRFVRYVLGSHTREILNTMNDQGARKQLCWLAERLFVWFTWIWLSFSELKGQVILMGITYISLTKIPLIGLVQMQL